MNERTRCERNVVKQNMIPKISVIIPVYNVEKYLRKCLDSVLAQTRDDYEVVLVDDGSTDSSPQICDEYAEKDERILVIHQENKGLSGARNTGIKQCSGEWITFLDSDDWWEPEYLEYMNLENEDLCVCGYTVVYQDNSEVVEKRLTPCILEIADYIGCIEEYYGTILNFAWGKMYRRDVVLATDLFDENVVLVEDILFNIQYYRQCKHIKLISDALVNYRQVSNSLSHKYYDKMFEYYELAYYSYIDLLKEYEVYSLNTRKSILKKYWGNFVESLIGLSSTSKKLYEKVQVLTQKQESLLYQECMNLYCMGELKIENRMQGACMKLLSHNCYCIWFVLIELYLTKNVFL